MSYNHEDLGNYSHTYVNSLKARIAELEAATHPAVSAEPVAWLVEWLNDGKTWVQAQASELTAVNQARTNNGTCTPLYATPPASEQARDAALDEAIVAVQMKMPRSGRDNDTYRALVVAVDTIRALKSDAAMKAKP